MLNKLVADRYIDLPDVFKEYAKPHNAMFPAHFVESNYPTLNIAESHSEGILGTGRRISPVLAGPHATKTHRTFRWLSSRARSPTCRMLGRTS